MSAASADPLADPLGLGNDPLGGSMAMPAAQGYPQQQAYGNAGPATAKKPAAGGNRGLMIGLAIGGALLLVVVVGIAAVMLLGGDSEQVAVADTTADATASSESSPSESSTTTNVTPTTPPQTPSATTPVPSAAPAAPPASVTSVPTATAPAMNPLATPATGASNATPGALPNLGASGSSGVTQPPGGGVSAATPTGGLPGGALTWFQTPDQKVGARAAGEAPVVHIKWSWMTELLPHLGHQELYDDFDFGQSWASEKNLQLTGAQIPEFLNPTDSRKRYEGYPFKGMGLTHFAGMSGIEDGRNVVAAKLPRDDPRAGIFGYDKVASTSDVTDGLSSTIMLIGTGELAAPWVQGGGATIRGAREPYFDKLTGFGSRGVTYGDGTLVVMADGSVKFIAADVDPTVFRAMSTMHGAETVDHGTWLKPALLRNGRK